MTDNDHATTPGPATGTEGAPTPPPAAPVAPQPPAAPAATTPPPVPASSTPAPAPTAPAYPGQPAYGHPAHAAHPGQSAWGAPGGQPYQGQPGQPGGFGPQPGQPAWSTGGYPTVPGTPGQPVTGQQSGYPSWPGAAGAPAGYGEQHSHGDTTTQLPPYGDPATAVGDQPRGTGSSVGKYVGVGIGAVVLAVSSGVVGAVAMHRMDNGGGTVSLIGNSNGGNGSAASPVLQRDSLATIAAAVQPSVVSIATGSGEGSGVVLTADGFVVTNNHVVAAARGGEVSVSFNDGRILKGKVVGTDARTDLGVVKVDATNLKAAKFGDSAGMRVGDTVLALGSPLGLQGSVTAGIISNTNRNISVGGESESPFGEQSQRSSLGGLIQTDAPINPGNSGGALVNLNGEVIGINTAIATAGSQGNIGLGFAIPSNRVKANADQLRTGQKVHHPFVGVLLADAESGGALITGVNPSSPAEKGGLRKGDIVTEIGGRKIGKADDLVSAVQSGKVGDKLAVTYTRSGTAAHTTITLGEND